MLKKLFVIAGLACLGTRVDARSRSERHRVPKAPPPAEGTTTHWSSKLPIHVYIEADDDADRRGLIASGAAFEVLGPAEGRHCGGAGWAKVRGNGFACLEGASPTQDTPRILPNFVDFPHPDSSESSKYKETGKYNLQPEEAYPNAPFIYARRYKSKKGRAYKSAEAYANGERSIYRIGGTKSFVGVQDTTRGKVLVRRSGNVVPIDDVYVVPLSRIKSRDVLKQPIPEGMLPAWAVRGRGSKVRAAPDDDAKVIDTLDYHTPIMVKNQPLGKDGRWWEIPDHGGPGVSGYVWDKKEIRHWVPRPAPDTVASDELWIDVDLGQQVLAVRRGEALEYITLVSTGSYGHSTPKGLYQIRDKTIYANMSSAPGVEGEDAYFVGNVPWIIHFWPRYAIHGAFWHWGFGWVRSHGCINMTLHDVRYIYEHVQPINYPGWKMVYGTQDDPGTQLRIRSGMSEVVDKRRWR
jgi:hypothetical protein